MKIKQKLDTDITSISPLAFAFLGDAIHTLYVREYVLEHNNLNMNNYNTACTKFCKASSQAKMFDLIESSLTEEEQNIARRARNSKTNHTAKNANVEEYKKATCLEAILGYLYMINNHERLMFILNVIVNKGE